VTAKRSATLLRMQRRAVMAAAAARYRAEHDARLRWLDPPPDWRHFKALHRAAEKLAAALRPFGAGKTMATANSPEARHLLAQLQAHPPLRTQAEIAGELDGMAALLSKVIAACANELGPNLARNRPADRDAAMFVCMAADAWRGAQLGQPASSERSPFWLALLETAEADAFLPRLTRSQAVEALSRWREHLGMVTSGT
jgi:hypothetical protein